MTSVKRHNNDERLLLPRTDAQQATPAHESDNESDKACGKASRYYYPPHCYSNTFKDIIAPSSKRELRETKSNTSDIALHRQRQRHRPQHRLQHRQRQRSAKISESLRLKLLNYNQQYCTAIICSTLIIASMPKTKLYPIRHGSTTMIQR